MTSQGLTAKKASGFNNRREGINGRTVPFFIAWGINRKFPCLLKITESIIITSEGIVTLKGEQLGLFWLKVLYFLHEQKLQTWMRNWMCQLYYAWLLKGCFMTVGEIVWRWRYSRVFLFISQHNLLYFSW